MAFIGVMAYPETVATQPGFRNRARHRHFRRAKQSPPTSKIRSSMHIHAILFDHATYHTTPIKPPRPVGPSQNREPPGPPPYPPPLRGYANVSRAPECFIECRRLLLCVILLRDIREYIYRAESGEEAQQDDGDIVDAWRDGNDRGADGRQEDREAEHPLAAVALRQEPRRKSDEKVSPVEGVEDRRLFGERPRYVALLRFQKAAAIQSKLYYR